MSSLLVTSAMIENYQLRQSVRRKTIALRVEHQRLVVLAPQHVCQRDIQRFIRRNLSWIEKQIHLQQTREQAIAQKQFVHGGQFALLGQLYTLNIINGSARPQVMVQDQQISMHLPQDDGMTIKASLFGWYRQQAVQYFTRQTHEMAAITRQTCQQVRLGDFKRQWGSCSKSGVIRYHWPLIQAPRSVVDYVIAHEVSHLTYMNHSHDFWQLVVQFCPDYQQQRKWLRNCGHLLQFIVLESGCERPTLLA